MKKRDLLKRIEALEAENAALRQRVKDLEARLVPLVVRSQPPARPMWPLDTNETWCGGFSALTEANLFDSWPYLSFRIVHSGPGSIYDADAYRVQRQ